MKITELDVKNGGYSGGDLTHERLVRFEDDAVGLRGFIAIHNTNMGPATGGTRFKFYNSETDAIRDVLDLSEAMTYKCAMAGVPFGGGKAVIMASRPTSADVYKDQSFLDAYARVINSFQGSFTTGKDVGIDDEDVIRLSKGSPYINGYHGSEDPSIYAALGVFIAMRSTLKNFRGSHDLRDKRISIKGLGKVGFELARLSYESGADLILADVDDNKIEIARRSFRGAKIVSSLEIHKIETDIYSPCALGAEFRGDNVAELRCDIICGGANNQLSSSDVGLKIMERGIIYVPDYVANAGGLIAVVDGFQYPRFDGGRVSKKLLVIGDNVEKVLQLSSKNQIPPQDVADELSRSIFLGQQVYG